MSSLNRVTLAHANRGGWITAMPSALLSLVMLAAVNLARADDLTGLPIDDPKDLLPAPSPSQTTCAQSIGETLFVPMPGWAKGVTMPPLPEQLKPMGKKSLAASGPVTPPPLAPPKDASAVTTETTTAGAKPSTPQNDQAMITVSPFLQWIKANPQAAATEARQQAGAYQPAPAPAPGAPAKGASAPDDTYWLPPLIDSADFGTRPVGGSAAIYTKPVR